MSTLKSYGLIHCTSTTQKQHIFSRSLLNNLALENKIHSSLSCELIRYLFSFFPSYIYRRRSTLRTPPSMWSSPATSWWCKMWSISSVSSGSTWYWTRPRRSRVAPGNMISRNQTRLRQYRCTEREDTDLRYP